MSRRTLRITQGPLQGQQLVVDDELVIGRGQSGAGSLGDDVALSRRHAALHVSASGDLTLEDLGSTNGTSVNGQRVVQPRILLPNDVVVLGQSTLTVEPAPPPPPVAAPAPAYLSGIATAARPRRRGGAILATALVILALAGGAIAGYVWRGQRSSAAPSPTRTSSPANAGTALGTVYVESNVSTPNGNSVLAFRYGSGGNLNPLQVTAYPTGGSGAADLSDSGVLDADQHIIVSADHKLLFAVNQGSDSVAVFHVRPDGALVAVAGSPFPSGGKAPASVGLSGNHLVVVNKAQDGIRDLAKVPPNYTTFTVAADGSLQPTGSTMNAPLGYSPTQALISTSGNVVMSTEEGGPFRAFTLSSDGRLALGPNSPLSPPESLFPPNFPAAKKWALGLGVHPTQRLLYAQMATVSKMAIFRYDDTARLTFLGAVANPGAVLPCWTLINAAGTRLYTDNAGNNTMSVYDISDAEHPKQIQVLKLKNNGNPWDVRLDPTGRFIFMIDPRATRVVSPGQGNEIHTLVVNADGTVSEPNYSPVSIPVGLNVNPIGLAVVGS